MKKKTLLLINPANQLRKGFLVNVATRNQPLGLGIVAALTPPDWRIKLIDENFREFRYYDADLVGITAFTSNVARAYEISEIYRAKGVPTVIGGIHASMMPEEAGRYADSVVVGEAESCWPRLIEDFEKGGMKPLYKGYPETLISQPKPLRHLFHPGYVAASVQTSRGCPMNCRFCSVSAFNGSHYRFRPIDEVLDEIEEVPQKYIFLIDDNIIGYSRESKERAKLLFEGIIRRGIKKHWISQSSINFADDPELVKLASRSGCRMIFMGIESESEIQLAEARKKLNISRGTSSYEKVFKTMHRYGIGVIAGLIFGWDNDTPETIRQRANFAVGCGADSFQNSILTPLPGTELYSDLLAQGRLTLTNYPSDWQHYDFMDPVFRHPSMSAEEIRQSVREAYSKIYSRRVILSKGIKTLLKTRNALTTMMLTLNYLHYRNIFGEGTHYSLMNKKK